MVDDREEQRRQKAYALWEEEGRPEGRHEAHWQQAEDDAGEDPSRESDKDAVFDEDNAAADRVSGKSASETIKPERPLEGS